MSIRKSSVTVADGVGVFTRGYQDQLEEAANRDPDALTTFRSQDSWRSAENALEWSDEDIIVYYCPRGKEKVHYTAVLEDTHLHPDRDDDETERMLATQLDIHREADDGLWGGEVETLYQVSNFEAVDEPFPFTELRKLSDNEPIAPNYSYSYSVVHQRE